MQEKNTVHGLIEDFPESEREMLYQQDIISIVVVPIFSDNYWWGFIGFDDCSFKRQWTQTELKALTTAADILGAAIHRRNVEEELVNLNNTLEKRVENRTKTLKRISDRKIAEMMLREVKKKYRQIFEKRK